MPYGRNRATSMYRRSTYQNRQKTARAAKVAARRKSYKAPVRKKAPIAKLARQVRMLRTAALGPVQSQLQYWDSGSHAPTKDSPFLIQVNDPVHNSCDVYHWNNVTNGPSQIGHFYVDSSNFYDDTVHQFNDRVYMKWMMYELEFTGYVSNTRLRVDVIQQKKLPKDTFTGGYTQEHFFPYALGNFKNLAGFSQSYIHPKYFKHVCKTKYVFMNTKASSSATYNITHAADGDTDEGTPFQAQTTQPSTKYVRMYVPFNKYLKARNTTADEDPDDNPEFESYRWNRGHPFNPIWMIISCDDLTSEAGDRVTVKVHRKIVWRDEHA